MMRGATKIDRRSHDHKIVSSITRLGTISEMRTILRVSLKDLRMIIKFLRMLEINLYNGGTRFLVF